MLSNAKNATYINLDVDEMLPCYSDDAGLDEDCELTGRDLHPSVVVVGRESGDAGGCQTLELDDDAGGHQTLESGDNYSIGSSHLQGSDDGSTGDHQVLEGGTGVTTERYHTLEGVEDDSRIAGAHVAVLDVPGETVAKPCEVVRCDGDGEVWGGGLVNSCNRRWFHLEYSH